MSGGTTLPSRLGTAEVLDSARIAGEYDVPVPIIAPQVAHTPDQVEKIRTRAYELYIERGCRDGCAEQDWLDAETEIMAEYDSSAA